MNSIIRRADGDQSYWRRSNLGTVRWCLDELLRFFGNNVDMLIDYFSATGIQQCSLRLGMCGWQSGAKPERSQQAVEAVVVDTRAMPVSRNREVGALETSPTQISRTQVGVG